MAGLQVLDRHVLEPVVSARFLLDDRDASAAGGVRGRAADRRWWTLGGLPLGSVEIVLGAIVLVVGSGNLRLVTVAIAARGLIGGTLLLPESFKSADPSTRSKSLSCAML